MPTGHSKILSECPRRQLPPDSKAGIHPESREEINVVPILSHSEFGGLALALRWLGSSLFYVGC
ncbi:hypothetical protein CO661_31835 [Sinorhizobium fredii]|uniref:Uncharacterized protein n=2 Tax=Rhizobium fredii TaxID=380 RepID=I3XGS0_SINF2|nr:hypothetical protein USDA257_p03610 [Sinorhizobium fredii USDA 257]PDT43994.1 hypothetical protein CO661_31835 [Sinorhizobium fredii]